jgi:cyclophilin family peptidyl-prolyl cis-trans isomerase
MKKNILILMIVSALTFMVCGCENKETAGENTMKTAANGVLSGQENLFEKHKTAIIKTNYGDITIEFYGQDSPITVNNFLNLASKGFYNKTKFHRVIKGFMIQAGDPNSRDKDISTHGLGGPGYKFMDEINNHKLVRGSLAMANAGQDTNGSQFFIITKDATPWLDGKHTNFGQITSGMDVVSKIENVQVDANDHPIGDVIIESIELK